MFDLFLISLLSLFSKKANKIYLYRHSHFNTNYRGKNLPCAIFLNQKCLVNRSWHPFISGHLHFFRGLYVLNLTPRFSRSIHNWLSLYSNDFTMHIWYPVISHYRFSKLVLPSEKPGLKFFWPIILSVYFNIWQKTLFAQYYYRLILCIIGEDYQPISTAVHGINSIIKYLRKDEEDKKLLNILSEHFPIFYQKTMILFT